MGELFRSFWACPALLFASVFFLAGVIEMEPSAPPLAALPILLMNHAALQESSSNLPAPVSSSTTDRMRDHYLMLVNTAIANKMDAAKMAQFDRSPYDGLAVSWGGAYDISPVPALPAMQAQIADWKKSTGKQIWPWVYLNRMIGANETQGNPDANLPYFQKFQGMDLDGKAGAQNDFLENWRNALRLARETGVPGIVCDLEFYNNYKAYDLAELARMTQQPQQDALRALRQLGARTADIAAAEYPGATLWFFFTGFTRPDYRVSDGQPYYLAATYIAEGLLDQIQQRHLPLRVLSGGEVGLGYCHNSVEDLRQAIAKRAIAFAPLLRKYDGILELAGTMTLWSDRSAKKNWVAEGVCGTSAATSIEELIPYLELLFRSYRYNWLYGSPNGGYFAFLSTSAPRFDAAIAQAKERAYAAADTRTGR
jgi:hypothetical protein